MSYGSCSDGKSGAKEMDSVLLVMVRLVLRDELWFL